MDSRWKKLPCEKDGLIHTVKYAQAQQRTQAELAVHVRLIPLPISYQEPAVFLSSDKEPPALARTRMSSQKNVAFRENAQEDLSQSPRGSLSLDKRTAGSGYEIAFVLRSTTIGGYPAVRILRLEIEPRTTTDL